MNVKARAESIRLLVLDVDGVLTDGGLYYMPDGSTAKRFNVQDGLGIKVAQAAGLELAVITGLDNECVARRVAELGIREYHPGHRVKGPVLNDICSRLGISLEQVAYVGDDWVDAGPMQLVGLPMAVVNAQPEILDMASWVSRARGGDGAVREAIRFLLQCQDKLDSQWGEWLEATEPRHDPVGQVGQ
ncbi:MAG: KdsC family phosphatase [Desulfovibrio sp.]|uniref:KdsC family phosphatase n=1 Tax=Desulfovibrio sp. 7SRBS1 TaxID=3378064 RepID=UPI003B4096F2